MILKILTLIVYYVVVINATVAASNQVDPPTNNFTVSDGNVTCIVLIAGLQLTIPYIGNQTNFTSTIAIPSRPQFNGSCGTDNSVIHIYFNTSWTLSIRFVNSSPSTFSMESVVLMYTMDKSLFPNATFSQDGKPVLVTTSLPAGTFQASKTGSFKCQGQTDLALNNSITLTINNLQYRALGRTNSTGLSDDDVQTCMLSSPMAEMNTSIAVSVGIALGVMIVVVILLYVIVVKLKGGHQAYEET